MAAGAPIIRPEKPGMTTKAEENYQKLIALAAETNG